MTYPLAPTRTRPTVQPQHRASLVAYRSKYTFTTATMKNSTHDANPSANSLTALCGVPVNVSEMIGNTFVAIALCDVANA